MTSANFFLILTLGAFLSNIKAHQAAVCSTSTEGWTLRNETSYPLEITWKGPRENSLKILPMHESFIDRSEIRSGESLSMTISSFHGDRCSGTLDLYTLNPTAPQGGNSTVVIKLEGKVLYGVSQSPVHRSRGWFFSNETQVDVELRWVCLGRSCLSLLKAGSCEFIGVTENTEILSKVKQICLASSSYEKGKMLIGEDIEPIYSGVITLSPDTFGNPTLQDNTSQTIYIYADEVNRRLDGLSKRVFLKALGYFVLNETNDALWASYDSFESQERVLFVKRLPPLASVA